MWTGHFAPALVLKTFAPEVPLGILFLVSCLSDALFFGIVALGFNLETIAIGNFPGTFPYHCNNPYTHSLLGIFFIGCIAAGAFYLYRPSPRGALAVFLAALSHWPLELPGHRSDIRLIPSEVPRWGYGLFDSNTITFVLEGVLVFAAFQYYISNSGTRSSRSAAYAKYLAFLIAVEHVMFSVGYVPTNNVRFVHAPMFLAQIAATCVLAELTDRRRSEPFKPVLYNEAQRIVNEKQGAVRKQASLYAERKHVDVPLQAQ